LENELPINEIEIIDDVTIFTEVCCRV